MRTEIAPGIVIDPGIRRGKPVIAGTRIPPEIVVGQLAAGLSFQEVADEYDLTDEQIRAALLYAARVLESEEIWALP